MNILAFDTCFDACSVAVRRAGVITTERELMRRGHAEVLLPMIERTMQRVGLAFADIGRIALTHGPGTFTGVRVGMSAALGLSFAYNLPVVTYSSLQCVARAAIDVLGDDTAAYEGVLVARDARRDSVYIEITDMSGEEISPPALLSISEARALARGYRYLGLGSGIALLAGADGTHLPDLQPLPPSASTEGIVEPDARFMLRDSALRTPVAAPAPLYLRPPDATPSTVPPLARLRFVTPNA